MTIIKVAYYNVTMNREQRQRSGHKTISLTKIPSSANGHHCIIPTCIPASVPIIMSQTIKFLKNRWNHSY